MMPVRVVIPSRGRVELCQTAVKLFPHPTVMVHDYEYDLYRAAMPPHIDVIAHDVEGGISPIKQWALDRFDDEGMFFVDDDIRYLKVVAGFKTASRVITDPIAIQQIIENASYTAREIGAPVFGFAQTSGDVRKYRPTDPIKFNTWVGAAIGFVGRDIRYDTSLLVRTEIDLCLRAMLTQRIVYQDSRFAFIAHNMFKAKGGNAHMRSEARNQHELNRLQERWGKHLRQIKGKGVVRLKVSVKRRQSGFTSGKS